jgi:hypothetical protein
MYNRSKTRIKILRVIHCNNKNTAFLDIRACSMVALFRRFGGTYFNCFGVICGVGMAEGFCLKGLHGPTA